MSSISTREFIGNIIKLGVDTEERQQQQPRAFKSTNVIGYPVFMSWGCWGPTELNASGTTKCYLFLPYLQSPQIPLVGWDGATSIESPLKIIASGISHPYNCKLSVDPDLNVSHLVEGEFYCFVLSLKPAVVVDNKSSSKPNPYWDGSLKAAGLNPNEVFKESFSLFALTKSNWVRIQKNRQQQQIQEYQDVEASDGNNQQ